MSRFRLAIGVLVVWLVLVPVAGAAEFPKGTFTASRQKDWSIKFEDKGKFAVVRGGMTVVEGTYKSSDTELTLTDEKGPAPTYLDMMRHNVKQLAVALTS